MPRAVETLEQRASWPDSAPRQLYRARNGALAGTLIYSGRCRPHPAAAVATTTILAAAAAAITAAAAATAAITAAAGSAPHVQPPASLYDTADVQTAGITHAAGSS